MERRDYAARRFGAQLRRSLPEHALRYRIADEYLEVTQGLWDNWDEDAIIRNRETGQFFVKEKLHTLNHEGRFFPGGRSARHRAVAAGGNR